MCFYKTLKNLRICIVLTSIYTTSRFMPNNSKEKIKNLIKDLLHEIITEDERVVMADKKDITLLPPNTFESYLKLSIGVSFTNEEKLAATVPNIKTPFARNIFEIRFKSTEQVLNGGKMESINKTTVIKKIKVGNLLAYKSFTLTEPTEKPEQSKDGKPEKPEPIKVTLITSDSFTNPKGDPALLSEFLKKVNDEIGL